MYNENEPFKIIKRFGAKAGYPKISENFLAEEWFCKCGKCDDQPLHPKLFPTLELLRKALGDQPIKITSGYRCPPHNAKVGGASKSRHMIGDAADIKVKNRSPKEVAIAAKRLGFTGVKVYNSWTHVDLRTGATWFVGF